ncbi:MAG TPA: accessory gene regulator B family protein [Candidatus Fimimorpha faecalis]|uniref:Accessory gene regulator B family protein n=1 Tax=Candidatus Fimimorpha faecalis TaxID=2840824 RepID=A0A9D1JDR2_9FIRM|nr:accessory gene regulator B family protein [Candidatus Fimimorpha faecalis]
MSYLSGKITDYIIKMGVISDELYEVYQYGFQIGMEMFSCFAVCLVIAIYLHTILEFAVFTMIFMLLRTYAGGIHMNSFSGCFICSVTVQTIILIINRQYTLACPVSWLIIFCGALLILRVAPVENINRELDLDEKKHCKEVTIKVLIGIIFFSAGCTFSRISNMVSLIALTILLVLVSQYLGIAKYKYEKNKWR